jgi:hypothetical protein
MFSLFMCGCGFVFLQFYLQPLTNEKLIEKGPVEKLFREVTEIQNINKIILAELEKRMTNWSTLPQNEQRIGDIFAQLVEFHFS